MRGFAYNLALRSAYKSSFSPMAVASIQNDDDRAQFLLNQKPLFPSKEDEKTFKESIDTYNRHIKKLGLTPLNPDEVVKNTRNKDLTVAVPVYSGEERLDIVSPSQVRGYNFKPNKEIVNEVLYSTSDVGDKARKDLLRATQKLGRFMKTKRYQELSADAKEFLRYEWLSMRNSYDEAKNPFTRTKKLKEIFTHELFHYDLDKRTGRNVILDTPVEEGLNVAYSMGKPWASSHGKGEQYRVWADQLNEYLGYGKRTTGKFLKDLVATSNEIDILKRNGQIPDNVALFVNRDTIHPDNYNRVFVQADR